MEWDDRNRYNSFNSYKGLAYYEHYQNIVDWMNGGNYLMPPIEVNLDPFAYCNLECYFCIVQRYLREHPEEVGEMRSLPKEYMMKLVAFLAQWGVQGLCVSGGGDPSLHPDTPSILDYALKQSMQTSFFTNAVSLSDALLNSLMGCSWVSLSVDAGDFTTYARIKGKHVFDNVVVNISRMADKRAKIGSQVFLVYKMLILPENQDSIYQTCKLAKELGVQAFHVRPVDFERKDIKNSKKLQIDVDNVKEQFVKCHKLEDDNFQVFSVTHKFDSKFHVQHDFPRCLATPLVLPILTDGNAYLCVDRKMEKEYKLGSCYPDPREIMTWWGSNTHRELIKSVNINECSRCTWSQYNRQITEAVIEDRMFLSFP